MPLKILGLDAGWSRPGAVVVEVEGKVLRRLLHAEALHTVGLTTDERRKGGVTLIYKSTDDARRMLEISDWLANLVAVYQPDLAVLELPSTGGKSAAAIKGMTAAAAVAVVTFRRLGLTQAYITPQQNKWGATRNREAQKEAMYASARKIFPDFKWPVKKKGTLDKEQAWAIADAIGCVSTWSASFGS